MNNKFTNQWLYEHGITPKQRFVSMLKEYAWTFKKRPTFASLIYIAGLDVQDTI